MAEGGAGGWSAGDNHVEGGGRLAGGLAQQPCHTVIFFEIAIA